MCTRPMFMRYPATVSDRLRGNFSPIQLRFPCGKCPECLQVRQNAISQRAYNCAKELGMVSFLTLTYNEDHLPISKSLWRVNNETGDYSCVYPPEPMKDEEANRIRNQLLSQPDSVRAHRARTFEEKYELFSSLDAHNDYYIRYTPSHRIADVQTLIKRCRMRWERKHGALNIKYMCISEFGPSFTRRPHYHLLFFGAPFEFVQNIGELWSKGDYRTRYDRKRKCCVISGIYSPPRGYQYFEKVNAFNKEDGSDGYAKIASYVGKYVGKGIFEIDSVKDGLAVVPRVACSRHLGKLSDSLVDYFLARDRFDYDPDNLPEDKLLLKNIVSTIVSRLHLLSKNKEDERFCRYSLNQIFNRRCAKTRAELPQFLKKVGFSYSDWPDSGKVYFNAIYYEVMAFVSDFYLQDRQSKFKSFCSNFIPKDLASAVAAFNLREQRALQDREKNEIENMRKKFLRTKHHS